MGECLIFAKFKEQADGLIEELHKKRILTEDDYVSAYLGDQVDINSEIDSISLSQPFLIKCIIDELGMVVKESNVKDTLSVYKEVPHKDEDSADRKEQLNYQSIIDMLNYLVASTRQDILHLVHQCARFTANLKHSHE